LPFLDLLFAPAPKPHTLGPSHNARLPKAHNLLGALLNLHFADVRPMEWTPIYAGNASRIDFLIKQQQIAIEAKMTRKTLDQKEVGTSSPSMSCAIKLTSTARPSCASFAIRQASVTTRRH
jgi:DNA-binding XRE family transcriptional regulator